MKKAVRIIKDVQSYKKGKIYRIHKSFADNLILRGKAEAVKEEKVSITTKEEKHSPEVTKGNNGFKSVPIPLKDYSGIAVKKIDFTDATDEDLLNVIKTDERKTAVKLATEEIGKREGTTIP